MPGDTHHVADLDIGIPLNDGIGMVVIARVVVVLEIVAYKFAVVTVVVPVDVALVVGDANAVGGFVIHVNMASKQVVVLVLDGIVRECGRPKRGPHEIVRCRLSAVGVGRFLSRAPLPVKLGMIGAEGDGADLFEEVIAVGILAVFGCLILKSRVVHNGHAVRCLIGHPQFIGSSWMELQIRWLVKVVRSVSDDGFREPVAEGFDHLRRFSLRGVGRKREKEKEHNGERCFPFQHEEARFCLAISYLAFRDHTEQRLGD